MTRSPTRSPLNPKIVVELALASAAATRAPGVVRNALYDWSRPSSPAGYYNPQTVPVPPPGYTYGPAVTLPGGVVYPPVVGGAGAGGGMVSGIGSQMTGMMGEMMGLQMQMQMMQMLMQMMGNMFGGGGGFGGAGNMNSLIFPLLSQMNAQTAATKIGTDASDIGDLTISAAYDAAEIEALRDAVALLATHVKEYVAQDAQNSLIDLLVNNAGNQNTAILALAFMRPAG